MITYELIIEGDMIYNFSVYPLDVLEWNPYNVDCSVRDRKDDQRGGEWEPIKTFAEAKVRPISQLRTQTLEF